MRYEDAADQASPLPEQPLLSLRGQLPDAQRDGCDLDVLHQLRAVDYQAQGYAELLRRIPWQQFWTLTFRLNKTGRNGGVHAEAADKAFRFFVSNINREIYGRAWAKRPHRGIQWARGQEFHRDGRLHFHAVAAAADDDLNRLMNRYQWHEFWYREFGRNQIEAPRSQADITGYVSKYVTKGGEVDFSKNFGAWLPPPIDYTARPAQDGLIPA
ncbi:replication endonuclease [Xanthomonas campestris pv. pennamericanum]|uniref:replication endonuclease n=1 Tax=Xanthomonas euvesicatoria TaxID=456327 RepID=UPI001C4712C6|nr:replication endonuclease [Xanthomonas euvesicatoria]MBV6810315.1 replication endonuclease [Xanthomonas campestris pv. pennamericanum]